MATVLNFPKSETIDQNSDHVVRARIYEYIRGQFPSFPLASLDDKSIDQILVTIKKNRSEFEVISAPIGPIPLISNVPGEAAVLNTADRDLSDIPENQGRVLGGQRRENYDKWIERGSVGVTADAVRVNHSNGGHMYVQHRTIDPVNKYEKRFGKYSMEQVIEKLDFPVQKIPSGFIDPFQPGVFHQNGRFDIVRTDRMGVLGVGLSSNYELIKHSTALEPAIDILGAEGFRFSKCSLKNAGSRVVIEAVNINHEVDINGDVHFPAIHLINSYDGSTSIKFQFQLKRVVCLNGAMVNNEEYNFNYRTSHRGSAGSVIERWRDALLNVEWIDQYKQALEVLNTPIERQKAIDILGQVFSAVQENPMENRNVKRAAYLMVHGLGQAGDPYKQLTKWDVYNGITETLRESIDKANDKNEVDRIFKGNERAVIAYNLLRAA